MVKLTRVSETRCPLGWGWCSLGGSEYLPPLSLQPYPPPRIWVHLSLSQVMLRLLCAASTRPPALRHHRLRRTTSRLRRAAHDLQWLADACGGWLWWWSSQFAPPGDVTLIMLTSRIHDFSMTKDDLTHGDVGMTSATSLRVSS